MGLPLYLRHIIDKYPRCMLPRPPPCRRLFVDFNGMIHEAAAATAEDADAPRHDPEAYEAAIIAKTLQLLQALAARVAPTDLLYVAVDGVPPAAKMMQQRLRRYMAAADSQSQPQREKPFDTNAITPGTEFMETLNRALASLRFDSARLVLVVSDSSQPGEGETKIFQYMTDGPAAGDATQRWDLIHGADADLIVRAMLLDADVGAAAVGVLRPPQQPQDSTQVVDVRALREAVCADMRPGSAPGERGRVLRDYVCMLSLVGNDFLPPLTYLHHKPFAVPFLVRVYSDVVARGGRWLVSEAGEIDWPCLGDMLGRIADQENARVAESHRRFMSEQSPRSRSRPQPFARPPHPADIDLTLPGWRKQWYRRLLNFADHVDGRHRATAPYLAGIEWTLRYYCGALELATWYYPFPYSPTALDLCWQCRDLSGGSALTGQEGSRAGDMHPHLLLALVLPPPSFRRLLPSRYHALLDDPALGCACFYVDDFEVFTYLKRYAWECVPNLPPIDVDIVSCAFDRLRRLHAPSVRENDPTQHVLQLRRVVL
jgi:5'-3' exonuclease